MSLNMPPDWISVYNDFTHHEDTQIHLHVSVASTAVIGNPEDAAFARGRRAYLNGRPRTSFARDINTRHAFASGWRWQEKHPSPPLERKP
jgi:hypothetical protein